MAWVFGIAAEFGANEESADSFVAHFKSSTSMFPDFGSRVFLDREGNWWGHIWFKETPESEAQSEWMQKLNLYAYSGPQFRYALAGIETDEFRYYSELKEDIGKIYFGGLILNKEVWAEFGSPPGFEDVGNGYMMESRQEFRDRV